MVLNVALGGAIVYGGVELRGQWLAAKAREAGIQRGPVAPAPAPPFTRLPEVAPVMASGYAEVAQKFLLDPSRNPDLPVEVQPPPPPPPPMPALPFFHGMMNIGNGPECIMSVNKTAIHQRVRLGQRDTVGQFVHVQDRASAGHAPHQAPALRRKSRRIGVRGRLRVAKRQARRFPPVKPQGGRNFCAPDRFENGLVDCHVVRPVVGGVDNQPPVFGHDCPPDCAYPIHERTIVL